MSPEKVLRNVWGGDYVYMYTCVASTGSRFCTMGG